MVRSLTDAPVSVTGFEVGRYGDGVSYLSLGFPGATVQLLQKLTTNNLADDLAHLAPDIVVLAFGTNEGFNDALNIADYAAQYEKIVAEIKRIRPQVKIIMIGPPDGARPGRACHAEDSDCQSAQLATADEGCALSTPPKLALVRSAQRELANRLGAYFWDWSSIMPAHCGAQLWAASNPPLMASDHVHLTLDGYKRSADSFADFLIPLLVASRTPTHVVSNN
jgi:lysophospholipase L1-like esterase